LTNLSRIVRDEFGLFVRRFYETRVNLADIAVLVRRPDVDRAYVRRSSRVDEDRFRVKPRDTRDVDRRIDHLVNYVARRVIIVIIRRDIEIVIGEQIRCERERTVEPVRLVVEIVSVETVVTVDQDACARIGRLIAVEVNGRDVLDQIVTVVIVERQAMLVVIVVAKLADA